MDADRPRLAIFTREIPAADPTPTDPEATGTRLGGGDFTPLASSAPAIASDGSRYLLTDGRADVEGTLLRSAGPGQPFTLQQTRTAGSALAAAREISVVGTDVVFARSTPTTLEVRRSSELGQTFAVTTSIATTVPLHASTATATGAVFAMLLDPMRSLAFTMAFAASPTAPITLTSGFTGGDVNAFNITSGVLLPASTGAVLVLDVSLWDGSGSQRLLVRRYDSTGAITSQVVVDPLLGTGYYQPARGCGLVTDAVLCVNRTSARRIDLATGVVTVAALPAKNEQEVPTAPIELADGRVLLPGVLAERPHTFHAGYRLSTDGVSWGPFQALRPTGGDGQEVYGVAAEAGGRALFLLGDSGLMMAGDGQTTAQGVVQAATIP